MKVNNLILNKIKRIEKSLYPKFMQSINDCMDINDLYGYCETSNLKIYVTDNMYCIVGEHKRHYEVVDLAIKKFNVKEFYAFIKWLRKFNNKKLIADFRTKSYKLFSLLAKKYNVIILKQNTWQWNNENMTYVEFKLKKN